MRNLSYIEAENDALRVRLKEIKTASNDLIKSLDEYLNMKCLRSELIRKKEKLCKILNEYR